MRYKSNRLIKKRVLRRGGAFVHRRTARRTPVISVAMVSIWNESSNLRASVSKSHAGAGAGALADAPKGHMANEQKDVTSTALAAAARPGPGSAVCER